MARTTEQSVLGAVCVSRDVKPSSWSRSLRGSVSFLDGRSRIPTATIRMALDCDCRNRCAKRCHRDPILGKRSQETFDKVRIALLCVVHEVMHFARRGASGVFERYRDLGPPGVSQIFGEDTASNHHQRQRPDRTKQATQQTGAPLEIELAEHVGQHGGYRSKLLSRNLRIRGAPGSAVAPVREKFGIRSPHFGPCQNCSYVPTVGSSHAMPVAV